MQIKNTHAEAGDTDVMRGIPPSRFHKGDQSFGNRYLSIKRQIMCIITAIKICIKISSIQIKEEEADHLLIFFVRLVILSNIDACLSSDKFLYISITADEYKNLFDKLNKTAGVRNYT